MDKRRQSILKPEGRIPLQEMLLPDFPDDDTATTTVTKSRRVSFGANFVKEFIVGSAVSTQFYSEYEQAFSSSDSSNPNSSRSGILEQSTFLNEDALNLCVKPKVDVDYFPMKRKTCPEIQNSACNESNEQTKEKNWDFNIGNTSNIFMEKSNNAVKPVRVNEESMRNIKFTKKGTHVNDSFSIGEKQMRNRHNDPELNSSKINENTEKKCKQGKFSSTICFSVDSPTADMEFTEGCISLAKSILDKKKKELTVYIQAKAKENSEDKSMSRDLLFDGSGVEMSLTKCVNDDSEADSYAENENSFPFPPSLNVGNDLNDSSEESENIPKHMYPLDALLGCMNGEEDAEIEKSLFYPERSLTEMLNFHSETTSRSEEFSSDNNEECDMEISSCEPVKIYTYDQDKENLIEEEKENVGPGKLRARKSDGELPVPFPEIKRIKKNKEFGSSVNETSSLRCSINDFNPNLIEKVHDDCEVGIPNNYEKEMSLCDSENFEDNKEKFSLQISCDSFKISTSEDVKEEKNNFVFVDMIKHDSNDIAMTSFPKVEVNHENFDERLKRKSENELVNLEEYNKTEENVDDSPLMKNKTLHSPTTHVNMELEEEAVMKSYIKSLVNNQPVNLLLNHHEEEEKQRQIENSNYELLKTVTADKGSNEDCVLREEERTDNFDQPKSLSKTKDNREYEMEMPSESLKRIKLDKENLFEGEDIIPVQTNCVPREPDFLSRTESNEECEIEKTCELENCKIGTENVNEEEKNILSPKKNKDFEESFISEEKVEEDQSVNHSNRNQSLHSSPEPVNIELREDVRGESPKILSNNCQSINLLLNHDKEKEKQRQIENSNYELLKTVTADKGSNEDCVLREEERTDNFDQPKSLSKTKDNREYEMEMPSESLKRIKLDKENLFEGEDIIPVQTNCVPREPDFLSRTESNEECEIEKTCELENCKIGTENVNEEEEEEEENIFSPKKNKDFEESFISEEKVEEDQSVNHSNRNQSLHSSPEPVNIELREEARGGLQNLLSNNCQPVNLLLTEENEIGEGKNQMEIFGSELLRTFTYDKVSNEDCIMKAEVNNDASEEFQCYSQIESNEYCKMEVSCESLINFKFDTEKMSEEEGSKRFVLENVGPEETENPSRNEGNEKEQILTGPLPVETEKSQVEPVSIRQHNAFTVVNSESQEFNKDSQIEMQIICNKEHSSLKENQSENNEREITNCETRDRMSQTRTFYKGREKEDVEDKTEIEENKEKAQEKNSFPNFSTNEGEPEMTKGITENYSLRNISNMIKPADYSIPEPQEGLNEGTRTEIQTGEHSVMSLPVSGILFQEENRNEECDIEMCKSLSELLRNNDLTRQEKEEGVNAEPRIEIVDDELQNLPKCQDEDASAVMNGGVKNSLQQPRKRSDAENEGNNNIGRDEKNGTVKESKNMKSNCISKGDKKIMGLLMDQEKEVNSSWKINGFTEDGGIHCWSFTFDLLGNPSLIKFKLVPPMEMTVVSFSSISEGSITLLESREYQSRNKKMIIDFGFKKVKNYFEGESRSLGNVHKVPLFLDKMNVYLIRINNILNQLLRIMKEYPGSRLIKSVLSFRLYSFPLMFSLSIMVDVSNPLKISESSISFEKHFGNFSPVKIKSVFTSCLKREEILVDFIRTLVQLVIDEEVELGSVTNRSHIRLII